MTNSKTNFLHSLHWFRAVAIIFVVLGHAVVKLRSDDVFSSSFAAFFMNGSFFFVFIAGYLFWHLIDRFEYKKYLINKIKNVISPYIIIQSLTLILAYIGLQYGFTLGNTSYDVSFTPPFELYSGVLWHFWVGGAIVVPFWFLPFIILVFISSYLIFKISISKYFYFIAILLIFYSLTSGRGIIPLNPILAPQLNFTHFLGIFFLGILIKKNQQIIYDNSHFFVFIFFFLFILTQVLFIREHVFDINYNFLFKLLELKMFMGVLFFISLLFQIEKILKSRNNEALSKGIIIKTIDVLAKYSFGIFFIHTFILKLMELVLIYFFGGVNGILGFGTLLLGTFIICIVTIYLIKIVFKSNSKFIVGS